ncbi:unnamed protein product [Adineta ricciae]|uniref:Uncharacterized protein n=1 Tax=Adineta ricciae TaxID=249248 RepID=A0A815CPD5_ADIRI|nr:unnamed protein product [Adineta ricciae]CAF1285543.1 unnamed protein product [Adineta ricciae]
MSLNGGDPRTYKKMLDHNANDTVKNDHQQETSLASTTKNTNDSAHRKNTFSSSSTTETSDQSANDQKRSFS